MKLLKSTPVLVVREIESSLPFWTQRLGFEKTVEVPHGSRLGFVILEKDGLELMLQTLESAQADVDALKDRIREGLVSLFHEVESLDPVLQSLEGVPLLLGPRETFYGMREVVVADPAGHLHCFAEKISESD